MAPMVGTVTNQDVARAYGLRAAEYVELFGTIDAAHPDDRQLIGEWSSTLNGPVLDVGSGPGQWTDFLVRSGAPAEGIEMVPEFLAHARSRFPTVPFRPGRLPVLDIPDAYASGILAWYSLIHTAPDEMPAALAELARVTRAGGSILVGFFEAQRIEAFPHAVVTAYYWPTEELIRRLTDAGFTTSGGWSRREPGVRHQAAVIAHRRGR